MNQSEHHGLVIPNLVRRTGGGSLAVAPSGALFSIAVTASTESEAKENFCSVYNRWIEIRKSGDVENTCRTQIGVISFIPLKESKPC
jgi:hypothetical protein